MPFRIKILPQKVEVSADKGETLLEAIHRAGVPLEAECGGQGVCESCVVLIVDGCCEKSGKIIEEGIVQSCQTEVCDNITIKVPTSIDFFKGVDRSSHLSPKIDIPLPKALSPLSRKISLDVAEAALEENASDLERLSSGLSLDEEVSCSLTALKSLPQALRQDKNAVTVTIVEQTDSSRIIKIEPGNRTGRNFGLACDIGTTTVALKLIDLNSGNVLDTASAYNEQIECGADIISRIIYAQKGDHLQELNNRILNTVNRLLESVLPSNEIAPDEITGAVFSGNTTMTHLLLGINPKYIREEPYVPAVKFTPILSAGELNIRINPEAAVFFAPGVGSYVGGDITSGVLCIQQKRRSHGVELFIDIGTNGELVVIGDDWTIGCACSAGPAFEGVGIKCGMRAADGAVDEVEVKKGGVEVDYRVIGGGPPKGICGSGLIELVAGLFKQGVIGRDGKFNQSGLKDRIRRVGKFCAFIIAKADQTADGKEIFISEQDIANIMRAKAAIFSATYLLLRNVGLSLSDIEKVYIAGGFGFHLNIKSAITIGLFPDIAPGRFEYLGNTSLMGAHLALLSRKHRESLTQITKSMTYIDLSSEANYMDEYTGALFLPHTDENLFPSVKKLRLV